MFYKSGLTRFDQTVAGFTLRGVFSKDLVYQLDK